MTDDQLMTFLRGTPEIRAPQEPRLRDELADVASRRLGAQVYAASLVAVAGELWCLARRDGEKRLCVVGSDGVCRSQPLDHEAANQLRERLPYTRPQLVGRRLSIGCGDRLGLATAAHLQGVGDSGMFPILAQQSIREMERTGRTPEQVMDDAAWGVFQQGYRDGFGSDADHLKSTGDIDDCAAAGFTLFTIDPGDHVDDEADGLSPTELRGRAEQLRWDDLEATLADTLRRYHREEIRLSAGLRLGCDQGTLLRAAVKYGRAVAHTAALYRHLEGLRGADGFELEVSVDETATPTTTFEHYFIATELRRLGVEWVSLAPRYVGEFEKGVDYRGDLDRFRRSFAEHVAVARDLGDYKLSVHSGSDKFSAYPIIADCAGERVHLKTAGTSYLEAVRAIAAVAPDLFRDILSFSARRYPHDRATYHVSAEVARMPSADRTSSLPDLLDDHHVRQVLHVTYGSVLNARAEDGSWLFRERLFSAWREHEEVHDRFVAAHMARHAAPFSRRSTKG